MLALLAKYKLMVAIVALVSALGVGTAGVAAANGALPYALNVVTRHSATPNGQRGSGPLGRHGAHGALGGVTHGSVIALVNGAYVTYTLDAGQVSAASTTTITLKRSDGQQVTLAITSSTAWGKNHSAPKDLTKLIGRNLIVLSQNGTAAQVGRGDALKNAIHADVTVVRNGKTREVVIDRGSVQSVSATQISVKRADGVVVTEPVAAQARWAQFPGHKTIQPGQVSAGASVAIIAVGGKVISVRVLAQPGASAN